MKKENIEDRESEFDYLRVVAAFCVIIIHVCAMEWKTINIYSTQWVCLHIYDILMKFSVPVFFMISGRFLLDPLRQVSLLKIRNKGVHIIIAFVFWSSIYTILNLCRVIMEGDSIAGNLNWIIIEFFSGEYHMWFLYAILGLYLVTPLLRKIMQNKLLIKYFLVLFFIFGLIWPMAQQIPKIRILFINAETEMAFSMTTGYVGYYVLGYYLYKYSMSKKKKMIILGVGAFAAIFSVMSTLIISWKTGKAYEGLALYLTPNVAATSIAIYIAVLKIFKTCKIKKTVAIISKYSFGCYLAHPLFLWIFEWIGFVPSIFYPVISIPLISICALILSIALSILVDKIPYLRRVI